MNTLHASIGEVAAVHVLESPNALHLQLINAHGERVHVSLQMATQDTLAAIAGACMMAVPHAPKERDDLSRMPYETTIIGTAKTTDKREGN